MGLFNHTCTNCGHSVSNKAKFCSACRAPQAEAWTTCEQCAASVGAESVHCWKCSANLKTQAERRIYDDRWIASPSDFAIRMVIRTPKATLRHGVEVAGGTLGLLFENGQLCDKLLPGYHAQDTLWERLTGSSQGDSVEVVLVNTRSAELDFSIHSLRDKAMIPVDARLRLEFEVASVADFVDSVVKQRSTLDAQDLVGLFQGDVEVSLRAAVAECDIRDLTADLRARDRIAEPLKAKLSPVLERHGLRLVEVRLAQFGGQALEDLIERDGTLAQAALRADQEQAMRRFDKQIELNLFSSELQLQEAMQSISHEYGLKQAEREHWTALWKKQKSHELTMDDLTKERELRMAEIDRRFDEDRKARDLESEQRQHGREEGIKDVTHAVQVDSIQHAQKQKKLADAIDTWKQVEVIKHQRQEARQKLEIGGQEEKLRIERENKIKMAQGFQGIETQAALVASGATPDQLIELAKLRGPAVAPPPAPVPAAATPAVTAPAFGPLVVAQVESCVALIIVRHAEPNPNVVHIIGTAFIVGAQTLATTAHQVSEVRSALERGHKVEAILPDRSVVIASASKHSSYSLDKTGPNGEAPVAPLNDVGLLVTEEAPFTQNLSFAPGSAAKGQHVFYVGYPVEEVKGGVNLHRPQAWFKDGTLGAITDFWGGAPKTAADALLLNHSCPMTGGASGSPLCNDQGQVIGIVSARNISQNFSQDAQGNMITSKQTSAVQTNYAQHIILLQGLI
jgi:Trypsin-like peptidase domain/SPFH domain / Band 7 family